MLKDKLEKEIKDIDTPAKIRYLLEKAPLSIAEGIAEQNELIVEQNKYLEGIEKALWAIYKTKIQFRRKN